MHYGAKILTHREVKLPIAVSMRIATGTFAIKPIIATDIVFFPQADYDLTNLPIAAGRNLIAFVLDMGLTSPLFGVGPLLQRCRLKGLREV